MLTPLGMAPSSTFRLLDLPAEIRNRIYEFSLSDEGPRRVDLSAVRSRLPTLALALVSRQVHNETIKLYQEVVKGFWSTHSLDISLDFLTRPHSEWLRRERKTIFDITNLRLQPVYDLYLSVTVKIANIAPCSVEVHGQCVEEAGLMLEVKLGPAVQHDVSPPTSAIIDASRANFERFIPRRLSEHLKRKQWERERFRERSGENGKGPGGIEGLDVEECFQAVSQFFRAFAG